MSWLGGDGNDSFPEAMLVTWGTVSEYSGKRTTSNSEAATARVEMHPRNQTSIGRLINRYNLQIGLERSQRGYRSDGNQHCLCRENESNFTTDER